MLTIETTCPFCVRPTTLQLVYAEPMKGNYAQATPRQAAFRCANCNRLISVTLEVPGNAVLEPPHPPIPVPGHGGVAYPTGNIKNYGQYKVLEIAPRVPVDESPEFLPVNVAAPYLDGVALLKQERWTAASAQFRVAIDRTTTLLWPKDAGDVPFKLGKRIEKLAELRVFPLAIVEWANAVRGVGNEIHALEDVEELDAKDAGHFCEVFLTYTYTLPARLSQMRARKNEGEAQAEVGN